MADEITYNKDGENPNIIVKTTIINETIDLQSLKDQLNIYKNIQQPTDEELIALGMSIHPYYESQRQVAYLEGRIAELEAISNG